MRHLAVREIMRMAKHQCGSVLIMERGRLLGIFTRGDLVRRVLAPGHDPNRALLGEVMTKEPDTIRPRDSVDEAIRRMDEYG